MVAIRASCFVGFVVVSVKAVGSGSTFGYELSGVQFPYVATALLGCMTASSGLLWANYRGEDFRDAEGLICGSMFGVATFGLLLSAFLALLA